MTWPEIRGRIANRLATVEITDPERMAVQKVHELPVENVTENPVFYMIPPALELQRFPSGKRRTYTMRVQFLYRDAEVAKAAEIAEAFREAMIVVFDQDVTLNGTASILIGPDFGEIEQKQLTAGGPTFTGFDATFVIGLHEGATYAP